MEDKFEVVDLTNSPITTEKEKVKELVLDNTNQKHELAPDKSVDVFNALNLYNEELGALYESEGYNPFEKDFKLTEEFINEVLEDKKQQGEISSEEFLEKNNKTIAKNFAKAFIKNKELINKLTLELENVTDEKMKLKMKKMIVTLKNRGEMLRLSIQKLKQKDANAIKMYKDLFGLDSELSEILKDEFNEKVNMNNMVIRMIELCNTRNQKTQKTEPKKDKSSSSVLSNSNETTKTQEQTQQNDQHNLQEQPKQEQEQRRERGPRGPHRHGPHHHHHRDHDHDHHHDHDHDHHHHGHRPPPRPPKAPTNTIGPEINM